VTIDSHSNRVVRTLTQTCKGLAEIDTYTEYLDKLDLVKGLKEELARYSPLFKLVREGQWV
jgi:hypothetical protein